MYVSRFCFETLFSRITVYLWMGPKTHKHCLLCIVLIDGTVYLDDNPIYFWELEAAAPLV